MATWRDLTGQQPELAALGQRILRKYGLAYLGTVRADGGPRIHPVCPAVVDGHVYIGVIPTSAKRRDLDRDGRFVLHGLPGPQDAEFCLSGRVRQLSAEEARALVNLPGRQTITTTDSILYELDLQHLVCITYGTDQGPRPIPRKIVWTENSTR